MKDVDIHFKEYEEFFAEKKEQNDTAPPVEFFNKEFDDLYGI